MLEKERKEFAEVVKKAFTGMNYPGDDNIVHKSSLLIDDRETTLRSFKGKHWEEITLETLILNRDHLPWFTPKAYRFYLPAFLIAVILHYEEVDVLSDNTLFSLTPVDSDDPWNSRFIERVTGFDPTQKDVIRRFLELYVQLDPLALQYDPHRHLQRAIEFWESFDE